MRDSDETILKLLQSLRDAEPAADMEQRILTAMQDATAADEAGKAVRQWVWWPTSSSQALGMQLAGAAVLALGLVLIVVSHPHPSTRPSVSGHPAHADAGQTPQTLEAARKPPSHSVASVMPLNRVMIRARGRDAFVSQSSASKSYPAPPLPLTQQERLLLRLARRRDPESLNILNPEERGAQTARATEQFRQFFGMNEQEMRTQLE